MTDRQVLIIPLDDIKHGKLQAAIVRMSENIGLGSEYTAIPLNEIISYLGDDDRRPFTKEQIIGILLEEGHLYQEEAKYEIEKVYIYY